MLAKHENDFSEFQDAMLGLWLKAKEKGEMTPERLAEFNKTKDELYKSYMNETHREAIFSYQKETLKQEEKAFVKKQFEMYPEVDYWRDRYGEMYGIDHPKQKFKEKEDIDKDER